jgi:hypothetical protein
MNTNVDDLWRLYAREWVIAHTITMHGVDARGVFLAAVEWTKENLEGRVREPDTRVEVNTDGDHLFWAHVKVFKENLKGEFKHFQNAEAHAKAALLDEYIIVPRNSVADHEIRSYGVKKL